MGGFKVNSKLATNVSVSEQKLMCVNLYNDKTDKLHPIFLVA